MWIKTCAKCKWCNHRHTSAITSLNTFDSSHIQHFNTSDNILAYWFLKTCCDLRGITAFNRSRSQLQVVEKTGIWPLFFNCIRVQPSESPFVFPLQYWRRDNQFYLTLTIHNYILTFKCTSNHQGGVYRRVWLDDSALIIPPATKLGGVYWIQPVCLSVCPSVRLSVCPLTFSCPPCSIYSSWWILSIFGTND